MQQILGECPDMAYSCLEEMMRVDGQGAAPGLDRLAILCEWYQFDAFLDVPLYKEKRGNARSEYKAATHY